MPVKTRRLPGYAPVVAALALLLVIIGGLAWWKLSASPMLTTTELLHHTLQYNGRKLIVRCDLHDRGEYTGVGTAVAVGIDADLINISPVPPEVDYGDTVELTGTYDAEKNLLHVSDCRILQRGEVYRSLHPGS